ncbi:hemolysin family protein [Methylopila musalis]|uniref:Hemolysin family protein n=1 Tax=Methylopila musalis TaxID=1134781 RepID=A0ABW3Z659_9HYPH
MSSSDYPSRDRASQTHDGEARQDSWVDRLRSFVGLGAAPTLREALAEAIEDPADDASVTPQERALLRNVLGLHDTRVDHVMVPRTEIKAAPADISFAELLQAFLSAGHSRLPVHNGSLDEPAGMVHIKDALGRIAGASGPNGLAPGALDFAARIADLDLIRPVIYAPPSMTVMDLLARMQSQHVHLALVVDEYGGVDGLVSIEDLVETIVGDIEDEHDDAVEARIAPDGAGGFVADARASLEDVAEAVGPEFDVSDFIDDVDTIGGLIVTLAGRVPAQGDVIAGPGGRLIEVLDANPRRVLSVRISRPERDPERDGDESDTSGKDAANAA